MKVGIVGSGADKFTEYGEQQARICIIGILVDAMVETQAEVTMISGHSPMGGVDVWAEEEAVMCGAALDLKIPEVNQWNPEGYGYRARNLDIAHESDVVHVIVVDEYPPDYAGRRFPICYHCHDTTHVKSGGCWTGKHANIAVWHVIPNDPQGSR